MKRLIQPAACVAGISTAFGQRIESSWVMVEFEPGYQIPAHVAPTLQRGSPGEGIKTARQRASSPSRPTCQPAILTAGRSSFPGSAVLVLSDLSAGEAGSSLHLPLLLPPSPLVYLPRPFDFSSFPSPQASPSSASRPYQLTLPTAAGLRRRREEKQTRTSFDPELLAQPVVLLPPQRRQRQQQQHPINGFMSSAGDPTWKPAHRHAADSQ
ncbi:hypothetical protein H110_07867 [Trichophyton rubrum MR1448]|nr:hypothetical protein H110_07867 [Trichophyton rubrum MR1448]